MEDARLFTALTFAGAAPFIAAALLAVIGVAAIPPFGAIGHIAASYALAIISFLAGTHWVFQLLKPAATPYDLFIGSNVAVVVVWFAYLTLSVAWVLAIQALTLALLLVVDDRLRRAGVVSTAYFRARAIATLAAALSLLVVQVSV